MELWKLKNYKVKKKNKKEKISKRSKKKGKVRIDIKNFDENIL